MPTKNKLLSILSDAEQEALYGLPDLMMHSGWSFWR